MISVGVSTRKVELIADYMGINKMSAGLVFRICTLFDENVSDLTTRVFTGVSFPYLWFDVTYIKARNNDRKVASAAVVPAIGVVSDDNRRLLGLDAIDNEPYAGWLVCLKSLREHDVSGVVCIANDVHKDLR